MSFDIDVIEKEVKQHMEAQPYNAVCADCGSPVDLDVTVDTGLDLRITVPICKCQEADDE